MQNFVYIAFFTLFCLLKGCCSECTHYYMMLKENFEVFDDEAKPSIEPISMDVIYHDYPSFNKTEEFKKLSDNKGCILEFQYTPTCQANPSTTCTINPNNSGLLGTDVHLATEKAPSTEKATTTEKVTSTEKATTTEKVTPTEEVTPTEQETTTETTVTEPNDTESPSISEPSVDITEAGAYETTTDEFESTTENIESSTNETDPAVAKHTSAAVTDTAKIVALVAGGTIATAALAYFIVKKIRHMLQYGSYHIP